MDVINCFKTKVGSSLKPSDAKFFILSVDFSVRVEQEEPVRSRLSQIPYSYEQRDSVGS